MNHLKKNKLIIFAQRIALLTLIYGCSITTILTTASAQTYIPPDRGLPGRREGGGTRGNCILSQPALTALVPQSNFGLTTQAHPTLFWYVPKTITNLVEFELRDEQDNVIYIQQMQLTNTGGIIQLQLPQEAQTTLEVGKRYHWYFAVICDPTDRSGDALTEGWIERTTLDASLVSQLEQTTGVERAVLYAQSGIWFDALDTLVDLQNTEADQTAVRNIWTELLTDVNLSDLADKPFVSTDANSDASSNTTSGASF